MTGKIKVSKTLGITINDESDTVFYRQNEIILIRKCRQRFSSFNFNAVKNSK